MKCLNYEVKIGVFVCERERCMPLCFVYHILLGLHMHTSAYRTAENWGGCRSAKVRRQSTCIQGLKVFQIAVVVTELEMALYIAH